MPVAQSVNNGLTHWQNHYHLLIVVNLDYFVQFQDFHLMNIIYLWYYLMDMYMENRSILFIYSVINFNNNKKIYFILFYFKALVEMANQNNGQIICPKTKELYWLKQAEKVYVM